jgi:hypothetical protein
VLTQPRHNKSSHVIPPPATTWRDFIFATPKRLKNARKWAKLGSKIAHFPPLTGLGLLGGFVWLKGRLFEGQRLNYTMYPTGGLHCLGHLSTSEHQISFSPKPLSPPVVPYSQQLKAKTPKMDYLCSYHLLIHIYSIIIIFLVILNKVANVSYSIVYPILVSRGKKCNRHTKIIRATRRWLAVVEKVICLPQSYRYDAITYMGEFLWPYGTSFTLSTMYIFS